MYHPAQSAMMYQQGLQNNQVFQSNIYFGNALGGMASNLASMRLRPGSIIHVDNPLYCYQPVCTSVAMPQYHPVIYEQPIVKEKSEPKKNSAMRFIEKLTTQDKSNLPIGSKLVSEEKTLAAVDLCHF